MEKKKKNFELGFLGPDRHISTTALAPNQPDDSALFDFNVEHDGLHDLLRVLDFVSIPRLHERVRRLDGLDQSVTRT